MPEAGNWGNPTPGVGVGWWECSGLCSLSTPQLGLGHRDPALKVQRMLMAAGSCLGSRDMVAFTSKGLGGAGNFLQEPFPRTM